MPKWRQYFNTFAAGFMCLLFAGLALVSSRMIVPGPPYRGPAPRVVGLVFLAFTITAIGGQVWFRRRILSEFTYDGYTQQFRTLGVAETQIRPLSEIAEIRPWRGRSGPLGLVLLFKDRQKVYLEYSVRNAAALGMQIESDLRAAQSGTIG